MGYDTPDTDIRPGDQLSLDVKSHPAIRRMRQSGERVFLHGTLTTKIEIPVKRDFNMGDELMVTITDADGQVVGRKVVEVESPTFKVLRSKDLGVYGEERIHKAVETDVLPSEWVNGAPAR